MPTTHDRDWHSFHNIIEVLPARDVLEDDSKSN